MELYNSYMEEKLCAAVRKVIYRSLESYKSSIPKHCWSHKLNLLKAKGGQLPPQ